MLNEGGEEVGLQNTLKALSDPIRREILNILKEGRMSAGDIVEKFPVTGASISRHLSVLKDADLIRDTREGKFKSEASGLRKTTPTANSLAHRTTWLRSDFRLREQVFPDICRY